MLLLDEPFLGLSPEGQKFVRDQILAQHQAGKTVVLSSHNLTEVTRLATHIAVLKRGRLVRSGPLESLLPRQADVAVATGPMPSTLPSQLRALSPGILAGKAGVRLVGDGVQHKAQVLRLLLDAGVDIQTLSEQGTTLEEVYLEATEA